MKVEIVANRYGVEVFADDVFIGGITQERAAKGPANIAEAVKCILDNFSKDAGVVLLSSIKQEG